jgi:hypothetical protein
MFGTTTGPSNAIAVYSSTKLAPAGRAPAERRTLVARSLELRLAPTSGAGTAAAHVAAQPQNARC